MSACVNTKLQDYEKGGYLFSTVIIQHNYGRFVDGSGR